MPVPSIRTSGDRVTEGFVEIDGEESVRVQVADEVLADLGLELGIPGGAAGDGGVPLCEDEDSGAFAGNEVALNLVFFVGSIFFTLAAYLQFLGAVNAAGMMIGQHNVDGDVVFKQSQLLESFNNFKTTLIESNKFFQHLHAQRINSDVSIVMVFCVFMLMRYR